MSFVVGTKRVMIISFLFIILLTVVIDLFLWIPLIVDNKTVLFIVGVILVFSLFFYSRVLLFKTAHSVSAVSKKGSEKLSKKRRVKTLFKSVKKKK